MATFGERLKDLRKTHNLRQKDLAKELGLAQTTIANYEQGTRFPNQDILNKFADYFKVSLDYLLGRVDIHDFRKDLEEIKVYKGKKEEYLKEIELKYFNILLSGKRDEAYNLVNGAIRNGIDIKDIYKYVFEVSLKRVGELWEKNKLSISDEHYFSQSTETIMSQLCSNIYLIPKKDKLAVTLSVNSEFHTLGIRMITDFLELDGWNTIFLGNNIPTKSVVDLIKTKKPDLLAISVTMNFNFNLAKDLINTIRSYEETKNLKIIVGGRAFNFQKNAWKEVGADGYAKDGFEAIRVANNLIN
ncbi:cobalamin-dependent protein [Thermohalobacter berrensis]|uniref:XRE family transcriptional regulator n=1 Tax=Thermohalobacter berrensis TaxID=99594 RepID=A0A419T6H2_9FIRM|nr:cobalamin-dependent protein [Thermohalobacter berrensis]RKD33160.1 hypothetical protein BET03_09580 [Thermohalobacter berrensis]